MTGQELHQKMLDIQAERGLEGTSWEEEVESGSSGDWDQLAEHVDEEINEAVVEALPGTKAGERTD